MNIHGKNRQILKPRYQNLVKDVAVWTKVNQLQKRAPSAMLKSCSPQTACQPINCAVIVPITIIEYNPVF